MSEHEHENGGIRLTREQMRVLAAAVRDADGQGDVLLSHDASGKLRVAVEEVVTRARPLALGPYRGAGREEER